MIVFLVTPEHAFTLDAIRSCRPGVRVLSYADGFAGVPLPRATYVFADLDRLRPAGRAAAIHLHRRLTDRGCPVVNDPARFLGRHDLLRRLHDTGINPFSSWRMDASERPTRWPVFLRRELTLDQAGKLAEPVGEEFGMVRLERSNLVVIVHPAIGGGSIDLDLRQEPRMRRIHLAATVMRDRVRGRPFAGLFLALVGAAQVCLQVDTEIGDPLKVGVGGFGIMAGAEEQAALHVAAMAGSVTAEIAEIADAVEGEEPIIHIYAASAG